MSGLQKLSRGFLWLIALRPTLSPPGSLYSGLPQLSPSSSTPYSFPYYKSLLRQWFGSAVGAAIPLFSPVGGLPTVSLSVSSLCPSLSLPTLLQQEPRVLVSVGPLWSAWTVTSMRTARLFIGVDSFIGNDSWWQSLPSRSHARLTTFSSRHASAGHRVTVSYRPERHI